MHSGYAYNSLICYKLSDNDVSTLRLVVTVYDREKSDGALVADVHCPELLKTQVTSRK